MMEKVITIFNSITGIVSKVMMAFTETNANKEIKKGNKLIASNYVNKTLGKANIGSNKESILDRMTETLEAYLVMATSYTSTDAMANAHAIAISNTRKQKMKIIVTHAMVNSITATITGNLVRAIAIMIVTLVGMYFRRYNLVISLVMLLNKTTYSTKLLSMIEMVLEYYNLDTKFIDYTKAVLSVLSMII